MRKLSEEKRKALARERFMVRHAAEIEGVLFAVSVLRSLRDRAAAFRAEGNADLHAFYLNGALNAVDTLLDEHPRLDELRACNRCLATGRDDSERGPCFLCEGRGERVLGSPWPDPKSSTTTEAPK